MTALLVSDLHLPPEPSPLREGFLRWLASDARAVDTVLILGDLFETWIGDDLGLVAYAQEVAALRALTAAGVRLAVMHGNRDFLLGQAFARATGCELWADPVVQRLGGIPTLLSHGDAWCTDDIAYQRYRRVVRLRWVQRLFLALPRSRRARIAQRLRGQSEVEKPRKAAAIMDVNPQAIESAFRTHGVARLIHGHTHRPAHHRLEVDGRVCERWVLPDWRPGQMGGLRVSGDGAVAPFWIEPESG